MGGFVGFVVEVAIFLVCVGFELVFFWVRCWLFFTMGVLFVL